MKKQKKMKERKNKELGTIEAFARSCIIIFVSITGTTILPMLGDDGNIRLVYSICILVTLAFVFYPIFDFCWRKALV